MVVDGNLKLGEAISKIAKAVKDISSLNMPIQFDSKGNPVKYAPMKPEDIAKAGITHKVFCLLNVLRRLKRRLTHTTQTETNV